MSPPKTTVAAPLRRRRRLLWPAAALVGSVGVVLVGTAAYAAVSHVSRAHPFPRPTGPARTVASIRTLRTHRLIVLQVWPGPTGRGTTLITPGGISRSCCGRQPKPMELAVSPEQIGTLPHPGMLLLWGAVGSRIRTLQLRFEDKTPMASASRTSPQQADVPSASSRSPSGTWTSGSPGSTST